MKAVLQITERACLTCEEKIISQCEKGMVVLLGIEEGDTEKDADLLVDKILKIRIFDDENGRLNLSAANVGADILVVSNFTLCGRMSSRRPDFMKAMKFEPAKAFYTEFLEKMKTKAAALSLPDTKPISIFQGVFGGEMKIDMVCDGPITILMDSKEL